MATPPPSRLDGNQVLQGAYDESRGRLRTDAEATVVSADIDVALDATEDNVEAWVVDENGNPFTDTNYVPVGQSNPDNLNANANVQQSNIDVGLANPLYTQTTNGALEVTQLANNSELVAINSELDAQTTLLTHIDSDLHAANSSLDAIESDTDDIRVAVQSIDTDFDVPLSSRATETTQLQVLAELQDFHSDNTSENTQIISELQALNTSTDNIESDIDAIRVATQSIDTDFDVALSTRATESTQLANNSELQAINSELDAQTALLTHIDSDLHAANSSLDAIEADTDDIRIAVQSIDADFDVALSTRATEVTQLANHTELVAINSELDAQTALLTHMDSDLHAANSSLDAIEADTDDIRIAVQSIDADFNVQLSTRASEATLQSFQSSNTSENNQIITQLQAANASLDDIEARLETFDTNYGTVGVNTLRTAAEIGNSTGAANFNAGVTGAQTLRTTANITHNGTELNYGAGTTGVDTLRTTSNITRNGTELDYNFGTVGVNTLRTAAEIGNATGAADFNNGTTTAQTLRTSSNITDEVGAAFTDTNYLPVGQSTHDNLNLNANLQVNNADVSNSNPVPTRGAGFVSTNNSTTSLLGISGVFTGGWDDVRDHSFVAFSIFSDVSSATNGLAVQWSSDAINVDKSEISNLIGGIGRAFSLNVRARYFRIVYTNDGVAQTVFRIGTILHPIGTGIMTQPLNQSITDDSFSQLVRNVNTGQNPDGNFNNERVQGTVANNSSMTPLAANGVYRGTWTKWSDGYLTLVSTVRSDVAGNLFIDASDAANPTNGVDTDVTNFGQIVYNPSLTPVGRRNTPLQSVWVRHRYVNGPAGQTIFNLNAILTTSDPGDVYLPSNQMPEFTTLTAQVRSVQTVLNGAGTAYQDVPIDSATGTPKTTISAIRDDILYQPLSSALATQLTVGTTPTQLDLTQVANRRGALISNDGPSNCAVGFSSGITYDSAAFRMVAGSVRTLPFSNAVQLWAITQNTGGTQTTFTRSGTTGSGTGGSTGNATASDNVYATISTNAQTVAVNGFTAGTANPLVTVQIGMEANKQTGQTETISFDEAQVGAVTASGTVASASLAGGSNKLYVAFVTRNDAAGTVTSVTGGGQSFTPLVQNIANGNRRIDAWYAFGTFTAGAVTATLSSSTNAHISVHRYTNVSSSAPIQASGSTTGSGTSVSGPALSGTTKGYSILGISHGDTSGTAGAGYTERSDQANGSGSNTDGLATETKALVATGSETGTYTLAVSAAWAAIGITLTPATALDPTITLSYELSAVPGATSSPIILSSGTDVTTKVNITPDRAWVAGDIPNIKVIATGTSIGSAIANIDYLFVEIVDTTGNTTKISLIQGGEAVV